MSKKEQVRSVPETDQPRPKDTRNDVSELLPPETIKGTLKKKIKQMEDRNEEIAEKLQNLQQKFRDLQQEKQSNKNEIKVRKKVLNEMVKVE